VRDPARIDRILALIKRIWLIGPDLRLLQLLVNVAPRLLIAPYAFEDDELEAALKEWVHKYRIPEQPALMHASECLACQHVHFHLTHCGFVTRPEGRDHHCDCTQAERRMAWYSKQEEKFWK
jgi:hypothetical protein